MPLLKFSLTFLLSGFFASSKHTVNGGDTVTKGKASSSSTATTLGGVNGDGVVAGKEAAPEGGDGGVALLPLRCAAHGQ